MFPGSAHTVSDLSSPPIAAPPAAIEAATNAARRISPVVLLFNAGLLRETPLRRRVLDLDSRAQRRLHPPPSIQTDSHIEKPGDLRHRAGSQYKSRINVGFN